jgi:ketosteroid isomerase-like protein
VDEAVSRFCAASQANDIDGVMATLAPDVELISPLSGRMVFTGRDDVRALFAAVYGSLRDVRWGEVVGDGPVRLAISEATVSGARLGDAMVFELDDDGRIRRVRPHLRPWLGLSVFALTIGARMSRRPDVLWRALKPRRRRPAA